MIEPTLTEWLKNEEECRAGGRVALEKRLKTSAAAFKMIREAAHEDLGWIRDNFHEDFGRVEVTATGLDLREQIVESLLADGHRPMPSTLDIEDLVDKIIFADSSKVFADRLEPARDMASRTTNLQAFCVDHTKPEFEEHYLLGLAGRLYLPQYRIDRFFSAIRESSFSTTKWLSVFAVGMAMALLSGVSLVSWGGFVEWYALPGWLAAIGLVMVGVAGFARPLTVGQLACLRLPGCIALGTVAILSSGRQSLLHVGTRGYVVAAFLAPLSFAYFAMEARQHGASSARAVTGALRVWALAMSYTLGISAIAGSFFIAGLGKAMPRAFVGPAVAVLATGAVALGLLLQVLWDDTPVTSPLGRLGRPLSMSVSEKGATKNSAGVKPKRCRGED